jgi:hypothetical protein
MLQEGKDGCRTESAEIKRQNIREMDSINPVEILGCSQFESGCADVADTAEIPILTM